MQQVHIKEKTYKTISLFSGCGGLDLGFQGNFKSLDTKYAKTNFDVVWSNDIDKNACQTYKENLNKDIVCADIRDLLTNKYINLFDKPIPKKVDIVLGGFPCQDFSHAGKRKGFDSERGTLYQAMLEVVKETEPLVFLAENVKGLLTMNKGDVIQQIIKEFESLGYNVSYKLFITADFGVPQKRERVIIIGTRKDILPYFDFPNKCCPP